MEGKSNPVSLQCYVVSQLIKLTKDNTAHKNQMNDEMVYFLLYFNRASKTL